MSLTEPEIEALRMIEAPYGSPGWWDRSKAMMQWWARKKAEGGLYPEEDDDIRNYAVQIPGVSDVIHLIPRAKITELEMFNHRDALRRHEPSPLSPAQLETLRWKRDTWLKIRKSATPEEVRRIGWYLNQVENVGDMMTAVFWGGKGLLTLLSKMGLKTRGPAAKYVGWALTAKDILDTVNMFKIARCARGSKKPQSLGSSSLNPLSKESKLTRGFKLVRKMPGIPDWIEIVQVTDQFFGVGLSFGSLVGFAQDAAYGARKGVYPGVPRMPPVDTRGM